MLTTQIATWISSLCCRNKYVVLLVLHLLLFLNLAHYQNKANLSLFYRCHFGSCSSNSVKSISLPYSHEMIICDANKLHDFSVIIPRCLKNVYVSSFFPHISGPEILCKAECFPDL